MSLNSKEIKVITDGDLIKYFSSFEIEDGFLILHNNKKILFTDKRYYYAAKSKALCECVLLNENSLKDYILTNGIEVVGLVFENTQVSLYSKLLSMGIKIYDCASDVYEITKVKTQAELSLIKKSCEISEKSFFDLLPFIKEGITENELLIEFEYIMRKNGSEKPSFDTIIAFGENSAVPHHKTGNTILKKDMPILIDFGCKVNGYCSDMTRTLFFGTPDNDFLKVYEAVKEAHLNAYNNIKSGMTGKEADLIARSTLNRYNLDKYFTHSLGHGIGLKIHENPRLSIKSEEVLQDGNVFSIEPGVYLDGRFGVRIEDTVSLIGGECVSMMVSNKNPIIL